MPIGERALLECPPNSPPALLLQDDFSEPCGIMPNAGSDSGIPLGIFWFQPTLTRPHVVLLHRMFGRERPGISSPDFDEVLGDGLIHAQLDVGSLSATAVGALFIRRQTRPPCPAYDYGGGSSQLSRLNIAQCLRERVPPFDQLRRSSVSRWAATATSDARLGAARKRTAASFSSGTTGLPVWLRYRR